jgi:hypothetical protein
MISCTQEILDLVNDVRAEYEGGERFFDLFDEKLRINPKSKIFDTLFESITERHLLILTGGFGKFMAENIDKGIFPYRQYILFKGGLRKDNIKAEPLKFSFDQLDLVPLFVDDTIFFGTTFYKIQEQLLLADIHLFEVLAVYDGSQEKRDFVKSLFRYYDHFQI